MHFQNCRNLKISMTGIIQKIFRSNPDINPKKVDEAICINTNKNKFDVDKINHDSNNIKSICTVLK